MSGDLICWRSGISVVSLFRAILFISLLLKQLDHIVANLVRYAEEQGKMCYDLIFLVTNFSGTTDYKIGSLDFKNNFNSKNDQFSSFHSLCFVHTSNWKQRMERGKIHVHRCVNFLIILKAGHLP